MPCKQSTLHLVSVGDIGKTVMSSEIQFAVCNFAT
jgi:hypothetical protein